MRRVNQLNERRISTLAARFPAAFRSAREALGLSVQQAAELLSVSKQTVYAWEHGLSLPGFRQLAAIRDAFSLDPFVPRVRRRA
jgi:transcriptional regulator with XRE-family HTH domain